MATVSLGTHALSFAEIEAVSRDRATLEISADAIRRMAPARALVERRASGDEAVYGINTGFGSLARRRIELDDVRAVQRNLILSHAAGVGDPLPADAVRAMMILLAGSLCRGHSGARDVVVHQLVGLLNHGITPVVPSRGSVGASGDLAPLAHVAQVLIGEGEAETPDGPMDGADALAGAGLKPIVLEAKEGLALINGTHLMTAIGVLNMCDIDRLRDAAIVAAAMAVDACRASDTPFDARIHDLRPQPGQSVVASRLRDLLEGSRILVAHRDHDPRVQDPYCLRAMPQVLGAAFDALDWCRDVFERETGAVTDNPLVFPDEGDILSGGNFHGMPLAIAHDMTSVALCHIAGIAERRINWLLTASDSENPVNVYLSPEPGLHSGLMIVQYTAAACVNELQTLSAPASVGNIPTSAGIEDYNSMGATGAHQARQAVRRAREVVSAELLVMSEALEYQRPLRSSARIEQAHDLVRAVVPRLVADRSPAPDLASIDRLVRDGVFRP